VSVSNWLRRADGNRIGNASRDELQASTLSFPGGNREIFTPAAIVLLLGCTSVLDAAAQIHICHRRFDDYFFLPNRRFAITPKFVPGTRASKTRNGVEPNWLPRRRSNRHGSRNALCPLRRLSFDRLLYRNRQRASAEIGACPANARIIIIALTRFGV